MLTKQKFPDDIETLFIEINFWKCKWLYTLGDYITHLLNLDKALDVYSTYDDLLITKDFNAQEVEKCLNTFLYQYKLKSFS